MDLMEVMDHETFCPLKGDASYWSIVIGDRTLKNVVWSYEDVFDEMDQLKDHLAFLRRSGQGGVGFRGGLIGGAGRNPGSVT